MVVNSEGNFGAVLELSNCYGGCLWISPLNRGEARKPKPPMPYLWHLPVQKKTSRRRRFFLMGCIVNLCRLAAIAFISLRVMPLRVHKGRNEHCCLLVGKNTHDFKDVTCRDMAA